MKHGINFLRPRDFGAEDEWMDTFLEVKKIRKGDVFFECIRGYNHRLTALTSARRISDGWYCVVENDSKERTEVFYSDFTSYPGPNFYREPQFLTEVDKEIVYLIN